MCLQVSQGAPEKFHWGDERMNRRVRLAERLCHRHYVSHVMRERAVGHPTPIIDLSLLDYLEDSPDKFKSLHLNANYRRQYHRLGHLVQRCQAQTANRILRGQMAAVPVHKSNRHPSQTRLRTEFCGRRQWIMHPSLFTTTGVQFSYCPGMIRVTS